MGWVSFLIAGMLAQAEMSVEERMNELFGNHQPYKQYFFDLKQAVLENNKDKVCDLVGVPVDLYGDNRTYRIESRTELFDLYDVVFSGHLLDEIKKQTFEDLFVNWKGVMIGSGEIWFFGHYIDPDGEHPHITVRSIYHPDFFHSKPGQQAVQQYLLKERSKVHPSLRNFVEPVLQWHSKHHIIRIDKMADSQFRYAAWDIESNPLQKPSLTITHGKKSFDGTGGNHFYQFHNGSYEYRCVVNVIGTADTPPGSIDVFKDGKLVRSQPVVKVVAP